MIKFNKTLKNHWLGPWLVGALCAVVLISTRPRKADAGLVEYAIILALVAIVVIAIVNDPGNKAFGVVANQLQNAANDANDASEKGDRDKFIGSNSKVIGLAEALIGIISSCDTRSCGDLRTDLQQIIGLGALFKSQVLAVSRSCQPNGVLQPFEQCDPLIQPNGGCPITIEETFCSEACQCEPIINP
jgi:Flp pilus assembly pilin Flp